MSAASEVQLQFEVIRSLDHPLFPLIRSVRTEVFVQEQQVDAQNEFDEVDGAATHILAFTASSASSSAGEGAGSSSGSSSGSSTSGPGAVTAVGTLRLFGDKPHDGHMGRVAIVKHARGKGWGKLLMRRGHEEAAAMGYSQIVIHAQEDKQDFYKKLGYEVTSPEVFYEENIPHVRMAVQLKASA